MCLGQVGMKHLQLNCFIEVAVVVEVHLSVPLLCKLICSVGCRGWGVGLVGGELLEVRKGPKHTRTAIHPCPIQ